ncbi:MAG: TonB-dependent receptor [Caulobacterales bacterium]
MKKALFAGVSTFTVAVIAGCWAPQAMAADAAAAASTASAAASEQSTTVGELIVVAERREQKIETVPVAVTAFSAEQRSLVGIKSIQDMSDFAPGLNYNSIANRPYLRGVGRNTDNLATASAVAIYYNGVYDGANANSILQHSDLFIDTIEVDRGPQNALHGSNADGGTINYITKKPTNSFYAEARVGVQNYDEYYGEAVVSGPISDNVRFRLGGNYTSNHGGYFNNLDGPAQGGNIAQGNSGTSDYVEAQIDANFKHLDVWFMVSSGGYSTNYHTVATRGAIPTSFQLNGAFTPNNFYGLCGLAGVPASPNGAGCNPANPVLSVTTLPVVGSSFPGNNPSTANPRQFIQEFTSTNHQNGDIAFATNWTYHFPNLDLTYLGGYQSFDYVLNFTSAADSGVVSFQLPGRATVGGLCALDAAGAGYNPANCTAPLTINGAPSTTYFVEKDAFFSHELNLTSTGAGPFQYILGLYWYHEHYEQPVDAGVQPNQTQLANPFYLNFATFRLTPAPGNPASAVSTSDTFLTYDSYAGFAQADYKFNDAWKVSGAIRYTDDHKSGHQLWRFEEFDVTGGFQNTSFGANTPALDFTGVAAAGPATHTYPGAGLATLDPTTGNFVRQLSASWSALTGQAGVDWTPDATTLAYFKYSRGYKSGGFSTFTIAANPETKAESVDAFEIGAKKTFGSVFTLNGAVFYYNYGNDQIPLNVQTNGLIAAQLFNLSSVHIYGVELEGVWRPTDALTLSLQYSNLSAKVANAGACFEDTVDPMAQLPGANITGCTQNPATPTAIVQNINGQTLPQATPNKVSFNALYTFRFDPGKLTLSGTFVWKDRTYDGLFNRAYDLSPSYSQVNLRATWRGANDRYSVIAFVNNLFNTVGYDGTTGSQLNLITSTATPEHIVLNTSLTAPRTFGVELQYRFK